MTGKASHGRAGYGAAGVNIQQERPLEGTQYVGPPSSLDEQPYYCGRVNRCP